jgi:hypothetical protein
MSEAKELTIADAVISGNVFSKQAVEGILADVIVQIKSSLDVVMGFTEESKLSKVDDIKATFLISKAEVGNCLELLSNYSNASLTPKHRMARAVLSRYASTLEEMGEEVGAAKAQHSRHLTSFAKELVTFLTNLHHVLQDGTSDKRRRSIVSDYCGGIPRADGKILH